MGHEIRWERHGVVRRFFDGLALGEILKAIRETQADARFRGMRYTLTDFREIELKPGLMVPDEIAGLAYVATSTNPGIKCAILLTNPQLIEEFNKMLPSDEYPFIRVFPTLKSARSWLTSPVTQGAATWVRGVL